MLPWGIIIQFLGYDSFKMLPVSIGTFFHGYLQKSIVELVPLLTAKKPASSAASVFNF